MSACDDHGHNHGHGHGHGVAALPRTAAVIRTLWIVLVLNALMFFIEGAAGILAHSTALQADSLDLFGDSVAYGLSIYVAARSVRWRAAAGMAKGLAMGALGLGIAVTALVRLFVAEVPHAGAIGTVGALALVVNVVCAVLLYRHRNGDSNLRSVWLCSRNDAIGNLAVIAAGVGVAGFGSPLPDLAVGLVLAGLQLSSAYSIITQARRELRAAPTAA